MLPRILSRCFPDASSPEDGTMISRCFPDAFQKQSSTPPDGLIFTGTGCSSGLPLVGCTLRTASAPKGCQACDRAVRHGPSDPNWRGNVGALLRFQSGGVTRHVQIDCGKTFRDTTVLRVYRKFGVKERDALILTHDHADAVGGLDEVRSMQSMDAATPLRCLCDRRTLTRLRHAFPYLFPQRLQGMTGTRSL